MGIYDTSLDYRGPGVSTNLYSQGAYDAASKNVLSSAANIFKAKEQAKEKAEDRKYLLDQRARTIATQDKKLASDKAIEQFNIDTNRPRQVEGGIVTDAYTDGKLFDELQAMDAKDRTKEQRALVDLAFTADEQKLYDEAKGDISKLTGEAKRKAELQDALSNRASGYAQDLSKLESRWDQAKRVAGDNVKYTAIADRLKTLEAADVTARKAEKEKAAKKLEEAQKYSEKYDDLAAKKAKAEKDWLKETGSIKKYTSSGGDKSTDLGDKVTFKDIEKVESIVGKIAGKFDTGKGATLQQAEKAAIALYKKLVEADVPKDVALQTVNEKVKGDEDWITDDELEVAGLAEGELEKLRKKGSFSRTVSPEVTEYDRQMKELLTKAEKAKAKADLLGLDRREQMLKDIRSGIKDPGIMSPEVKAKVDEKEQEQIKSTITPLEESPVVETGGKAPTLVEVNAEKDPTKRRALAEKYQAKISEYKNMSISEKLSNGIALTGTQIRTITDGMRSPGGRKQLVEMGIDLDMARRINNGENFGVSPVEKMSGLVSPIVNSGLKNSDYNSVLAPYSSNSTIKGSLADQLNNSGNLSGNDAGQGFEDLVAEVSSGNVTKEELDILRAEGMLDSNQYSMLLGEVKTASLPVTQADRNKYKRGYMLLTPEQQDGYGTFEKYIKSRKAADLYNATTGVKNLAGTQVFENYKK